MKKTIGILTFHYVDNYGAVLQTYALRKVINSFDECQAEIINYVPEKYNYPIYHEYGMLNLQKNKNQKFKEFLAKYCGICTPMIHSVTGNVYDVYLAGSDQIWNTDIPIVTADYEYFFPHLDQDAKRVAYSASIGMEFEKIDRDLFQKYLGKFHEISLREKSYVNLVSELSGKKCGYTLDPTMLLNASDYEPLIEKPNNTEEEYILYFWYDMGDSGLESIELVNTISRKYNLSVKHTFAAERCLARQLLVNRNEHIMQCGIGEFLWYIKNAKVVVTNSFHGTIFSILYKKPLYIYYPLKRKSRQENLINLFNLQDRVVKGHLGSDKLNLKTNYNSVYEILEREREKSILYLKNALEVI